jgi:hypothetical protein
MSQAISSRLVDAMGLRRGDGERWTSSTQHRGIASGAEAAPLALPSDAPPATSVVGRSDEPGGVTMWPGRGVPRVRR